MDTSFADNKHSRVGEKKVAKKLYAWIILVVVVALVVMTLFMGKSVPNKNQTVQPAAPTTIPNSQNHDVN